LWLIVLFYRRCAAIIPPVGFSLVYFNPVVVSAPLLPCLLLLFIRWCPQPGRGLSMPGRVPPASLVMISMASILFHPLHLWTLMIPTRRIFPKPASGFAIHHW
jgi:hypothetical protein